MSRAFNVSGALGDATGVLFLCSGNVVRSAFAELYARHRGLALPVRSAATRYRNHGVFSETQKALLGQGVELSSIRRFRSTFLDDIEGELEPGLIVFGMCSHHLAPLAEHPVIGGRLFLLAALLGRPREEILDPVLEGADFGETFQLVADCVDALHDRL